MINSSNKLKVNSIGVGIMDKKSEPKFTPVKMNSTQWESDGRPNGKITSITDKLKKIKEADKANTFNEIAGLCNHLF